VARPDGLRRVDVLLHHGPEDGGLAIVEHGCRSMIRTESAVDAR